jgi:hypothetical protein
MYGQEPRRWDRRCQSPATIHGDTLATRTTKDFRARSMELVDPWIPRYHQRRGEDRALLAADDASGRPDSRVRIAG